MIESNASINDSFIALGLFLFGLTSFWVIALLGLLNINASSCYYLFVVKVARLSFL